MAVNGIVMDSTKNELFLARMTALNKGFVKFVLKNLDEFPGADLTPTIKSYLKHVTDLDKKFAGGDEAKNTQTQSNTSTTLSTTSRKRTLPSSFEIRSFTPKKAAIQQYDGIISEQPRLTVAEKPVEPKSLAPQFSLLDNSSTTVEKPAEPKSLAPQFSLFGNSSTTVEKPAESKATVQQTSLFGVPPSADKSAEPKVAVQQTSLFGVPPSTDKSAEPKAAVPSFSFSSTTDKPAEPKPASQSSSLFGSMGTLNKQASLFGVPSSTDKPAEPKIAVPSFSFSSTTDKPAEPKPASQSFLFGAGNSSTTPQFPLFSNQPTASKTEEPKASEQDENEEPPKVEIVEQKEDGAVFFMKTSVFTFKDNKWEKVGVGYVNVMPGEKDNRLLVRAANTLGTIWVNTYIAEHFKAFLKGDKAMTVRFPDAGKDDKPQIVQYLFKGGEPEDFRKLADHLKANVVKT